MTLSCLAALAAAASVNIAACVGQPGETESLDEEGSIGEAEGEWVLPPLDPCIIVRRGSTVGDVQDAYVEPVAPTINFGGGILLRAAGGQRTLVRFEINAGAIPPGATIRSAQAVFVPGEDPGSGTLDVHRITGLWNEKSSPWISGVTYNSQPAFDASPIRMVPYSGMHTVRVDLTQQVMDWIQNPNQNQGIMLEGEANFNAASSEASANTPYLQICYVPSPCEGAADGTSCNQPGHCRTNGTCQGGLCVGGSPAPAGTVCRASYSTCDVGEVCNGTSTQCPAPALAPTSTVCRESTGPCDPAETCNGASTNCPANQLSAAGTVCRAASGACDAAETCTGSSVECPDDGVKAAGTVCRSATGVCDAAEVCNGSSKSCPANVLKAAGTECRAANGVCDIKEECSGASTSCPSDVTQPNGVMCGNDMACGAGVCSSCGSILQPCCDDTCDAGAYCTVGSTCAPCGGDGQACCPPDSASPGCASWNFSCQQGKCYLKPD